MPTRPVPAAGPRKLARLLGRAPGQVAVFTVRIYQLLLSPALRQFLGPGARCRFQPTCSSYALACFREHRFHRALYLSVRRLLKCHPFHEGGFDPVPPAAETGRCRDRFRP